MATIRWDNPAAERDTTILRYQNAGGARLGGNAAWRSIIEHPVDRRASFASLCSFLRPS
jgi:hypothetical protein